MVTQAPAALQSWEVAGAALMLMQGAVRPAVQTHSAWRPGLGPACSPWSCKLPRLTIVALNSC